MVVGQLTFIRARGYLYLLHRANAQGQTTVLISTYLAVSEMAPIPFLVSQVASSRIDRSGTARPEIGTAAKCRCRQTRRCNLFIVLDWLWGKAMILPTLRGGMRRTSSGSGELVKHAKVGKVMNALPGEVPVTVSCDLAENSAMHGSVQHPVHLAKAANDRSSLAFAWLPMHFPRTPHRRFVSVTVSDRL
ncbi:hypothetical protein L1887_54018 [Cichorium endivia]|nr:hypothetical protein L1887_54018 [Cichorium endivia]